MKKNGRNLVYGALGIIISFSTLSAEGSTTGAGVQVESNDDGYYDDNVIWIGPGIYYGIWFGNEGEFNDYRYNHHYHHYDDHHDGHHGGGHHH